MTISKTGSSAQPTAVRTSKTHPLQIAEVDHLDGTLGITFCPGKKQLNGMTGAWDRDLNIDMAAIKEWNPDFVIACCEPHEYVKLKVPHIFSEFAHFGINVVPLAFPDDTVPNDHLNQALDYWIPKLASCIAKKGRVLYFCKGGLGRSGFLLARTLLELGVPPRTALARLRAVRPGAVYTQEQESTIYEIYENDRT